MKGEILQAALFITVYHTNFRAYNFRTPLKVIFRAPLYYFCASDPFCAP